VSKTNLLIRLRERLAHPSSADEIIRILRIPRLERPVVKRQLRALVDEGALVRVRGTCLPQEAGNGGPRSRAPC
jgi:hypothetical protein